MEERKFYREYDPNSHGGEDLTPVQHQREALEAIRGWHREHENKPAGGILTIPTGGGKTFVATRFLCQEPVADGRKVLWLAHTHHLLEQAFEAFGEAVKQTTGRSSVSVRTVSGGAPGHFAASRIEPSDDIVIATIQTIRSAYNRQVPQFQEFLDEAGDELFVVFDEAHHAPANTYRKLLQDLQEDHTRTHFLGMTATPTYTDEDKRGWLWELFPQGIIHQSTPSELMATGVLAEPELQEVHVDFTPDFPEDEYQDWVDTNRDLPERVVEQLAESRDRNQQIADHYAAHKNEYGKTLIFADRRTQCVTLETMLEERGVDAASVMSKRDWQPPTPEARNRRTYDSNDEAIEAFRDGQLDVLVNVRMLTEGTDVPQAETVFLTRQTTSRILLTQMIGRALRGPKFGGTDTAKIVAFIDNWKHLIQWARFDEIDGGLVDDKTEYGDRPPVEWIRIDLLRRLARQMDSGVNVNPAPFTEMLPEGWYRVEFQLAGEYDDVEYRRELMVVYEHQREPFEQLIGDLEAGVPDMFAREAREGDGEQLRERVDEQVDHWLERYFDQPEDLMDNVRPTVRNIARHMAQNNRVPPKFFPFEEREEHDLDLVAAQLLENNVGFAEVDGILRQEYQQTDRLWQDLYPQFQKFKHAFQACVNRLESDETETGPAKIIDDATPDRREPTQAEKDEVIERDRWRCLCCDYDRESSLEVDHVRPYFFGGKSLRDNLQTLCTHCNRQKGTREINFRTHRTPLESPKDRLVVDRIPPDTKSKAKNAEWWHHYVARVVNFFYACDAVADTDIGEAGDPLYNWKVHLFSGNNPEWLAPHLPKLVDYIRDRRTEFLPTPAPDRLVVYSKQKPRVEYDVDTGEVVGHE